MEPASANALKGVFFAVLILSIASIVFYINRKEKRAIAEGLRDEGLAVPEQPGFFARNVKAEHEGHNVGVKFTSETPKTPTRTPASVEVGGMKVTMGQKQKPKRIETTHVTVIAPQASDLRLRVTPETLVDQIAKTLGGEDIVLGDEALDAAFRVKGSDGPRVAALLRGELGHALRQLSLKELTLRGNKLQLNLDGKVMDPTKLAHAIRLATSICQRAVTNQAPLAGAHAHP